MKVLVTGAAGFVGSKVVSLLTGRADEVVGIDNLNAYYDIQLKKDRLATFGGQMRFVQMDICDAPAMDALFARERFDAVVSLAAQVGVRHSFEAPAAYFHTNVDGLRQVLDCCRRYAVRHLVFASSSSVYGNARQVPFREDMPLGEPLSVYAGTKQQAEALAASYARLYGMTVTALRYFSVYGPWGRPDMAPMLFARSIAQGCPLQLYGEGKMLRDFTFIDDIARGTVAVLDKRLAPEDGIRVPAAGTEGVFKIYNIGAGLPVALPDFIALLEEALGRKAVIRYLPMQEGDAYRTWADTSLLERETGFRPQVSLEEGVARFVRWFQSRSNS